MLSVKNTMQNRELTVMDFETYNAKMNEIIFKHDNVADSLIEMLEFAGNVKLIPSKKSVIVTTTKTRKP